MGETTGDSGHPEDGVYEAVKEAAEVLGMTVGPLIVPTPEMQQAAADRLELAEVAICEASGDLRPFDGVLDPQSRKQNSPWSDRQSDPLWLLTTTEYDALPDGTELVSINGQRKVKGTDYIDQDTRAGFIAWGLLESQLSGRSQADG